jgi:hypothetical protein
MTGQRRMLFPSSWKQYFESAKPHMRPAFGGRQLGTMPPRTPQRPLVLPEPAVAGVPLRTRIRCARRSAKPIPIELACTQQAQSGRRIGLPRGEQR